MLIIVDAKIPVEAKKKLSTYGNLMEIETSGITYPAISGHPDIFFTQDSNQLIVAPNLPEHFLQKLHNQNIHFLIGQNPVGQQYPKTAGYNAVIAKNYLVHNLKITEPSILDHARHKTMISVNQGYTRCNLVFLDDHRAITSDQGIRKHLENAGVETLFLNPAGIILPGFDHGFIGGCCGMLKNQFFCLGNLNKYPDGEKLKSYLDQHQIELVELCDTALFDGGGIFFA